MTCTVIILQIFGMDNLSGSLVWRLYLPTLSGARTILLRRAARHPHTAMITIVGTHTVHTHTHS